MTITRRSLLAAACGLVATSTGGPVLGQAKPAEPAYSDRKLTDDWIVQWLNSPHAATTPLHLGRFADAMYFLREPVGWKPNPGQESHHAVQVPVGFVTDFASIPRIFWIALPKDGTYTYAAIVHDYLYWVQPVLREEADLILRFAMEDFKVDAASLNAIYAGVRLGGGGAWKENAELKATGERRFLKVYPDDPTITWETWKRRPGVFR